MAKRHGTMRRYRAEEVLEMWDDVESDFEGSVQIRLMVRWN